MKEKLTIEWEFPAELENKINGFDIHRSDQVDGVYTKINTSLLSVTTRSFEDPSPSPKSNYYKVKTEDENGYTLASNAMLGQLKDTIPPVAPAGLAGESDDNGLVTLTWNKNTEEDLMGYRVFVSNTPSGDFAQITAQWLNDTTFQHQINLNSLSEYVYFAVKAIDYRQNPSELSLPIMVERPDIIPPSPPAISNVVAETGKVHFTFEFSSSPDARDYEFQRKPHGVSGWVTLWAFNLNQAEPLYTDSTASVTRYWDYRLLAIDEVGNTSSSKVVKAKPIDNGIRPDVMDFNGMIEAIDVGNVILGWNYVKDPDLEGFEIYRGVDNNSKRSFKFVTVDEARLVPSQQMGTLLGYRDFDTDFKNIPVQTSYTAGNLPPNTTIVGGTVYNNGTTTTIVPGNANVANNPVAGVTLKYWIIARYMDGAMSPLAGPVSVQIP